MRFVVTVPSVAFTFDKKLLRKVLRQAGNKIKAKARALIGSDASGRVYGSHHASSDGKPPASLSGALAASLKVKVTGDRLSIKATKFYAKMLETGSVGGGGKQGSKTVGREHKKGGAKGQAHSQRVMKPRPFISTATDSAMPSLEKQIAQALRKGIDLKTLSK